MINPNLNIIVAVDNMGGFGLKGKIPWHFPEDFKRFKEITKDTICIMGRVTYQDMLGMIKARQKKKKKVTQLLANRTCYVVSSNKKLKCEGATRVDDIQDVINKHPNKKIFILGGERMYTRALSSVKKVYCTVINKDYECDRFFPVEFLDEKCSIVKGDKYIASDKTEIYFMEYSR